jgi:hypothetical protein
MLRDAVREAFAVGRASAINLPDAIVDDTMAFFDALPPSAKSSMLDDLERGRPLELPWLSGAVVRIGREHGVQTPTHRFVAAALGPVVRGSAAHLKTNRLRDGRVATDTVRVARASSNIVGSKTDARAFFPFPTSTSSSRCLRNCARSCCASARSSCAARAARQDRCLDSLSPPTRHRRSTTPHD